MGGTEISSSAISVTLDDGSIFGDDGVGDGDGDKVSVAAIFGGGAESATGVGPGHGILEVVTSGGAAGVLKACIESGRIGCQIAQIDENLATSA